MAYGLDIERIFSFHPADTERKRELHEEIRNDAKRVARDWDALLPNSAEKTLAIRKLQEAMFYANSAIAQYYRG